MPEQLARPFTPLAIGALYPAVERGLTADVLATRALGGQAFVVCTSHIVAGHGRVTDVLEVPSDTVAAQLEHVFETVAPTGAKVGIVGSAASAEAILRLLGQRLTGPLVLDFTLSGPSGEDLADARVREVLSKALPLPDLVAVRRVDAELVVGMEIDTLDDAQVAAQRLQRLGARRVLLRLGSIGTGTGPEAERFHSDLYFDGDDFALFEAPMLSNTDRMHGASSALTMAILKGLWEEKRPLEAIQEAKRFVTDAVRMRETHTLTEVPAYYFAAQPAARPS